jgi:hypothetical protein
MVQLYLVERQRALDQAAQEKMDRLRFIPGMMVASSGVEDFEDPAEADAESAATA